MLLFFDRRPAVLFSEMPCILYIISHPLSHMILRENDFNKGSRKATIVHCRVDLGHSNK